MAAEQRSELEQDMVQSLVESKAVDFEAAGNVLAKFGAAGGRRRGRHQLHRHPQGHP